jgi:hypothetical protein
MTSIAPTPPGQDAALGRRSLPAAALRTWLGYAVPLTALSALALAPVVVIALQTRTPVDPPAAAATLVRGWLLISTAWFSQLVLVGGAAAIIRDPGSQRRAFTAGVVGLARAIVPCLAAAAAVAIAGLALAAPAVVVLVLLALTGASPGRGVPAALHDSIAAVRADWRAVAITVAAMIALDVAIGAGAFRLVVAPALKVPGAAHLIATRDFVRAIALALVVASPLPATALATIRARAAR